MGLNRVSFVGVSARCPIGAFALILSLGACSQSASPVAPFSAGLEVPINAPQALAVGSKDPCAHFKGPRLYTSAIQAENEESLLALKTTGDGDVPALCAVTSIGTINDVEGLAVDQAAHLWETSWSSNGEIDSVLVFAAHANGDVQPVQRISGSNTLLSNQAHGYEQGIAIDPAGDVWVPNINGCGGYVTVYANSASGNVAPIATIGLGDNGQAEGILEPTAVAFDSHGNLYVSNLCGTPNTVVVFSPPFSDRSKPVATWLVRGNNASALYIAIDGRDNVWVEGNSNLNMFPNGLKSGGKATVLLQNLPAILFGLAVDAARRVYVANESPPEIDVLPPHPTSFSPIRRIMSSSWSGSQPNTLAIGP